MLPRSRKLEACDALGACASSKFAAGLSQEGYGLYLGLLDRLGTLTLDRFGTLAKLDLLLDRLGTPTKLEPNPCQPTRIPEP